MAGEADQEVEHVLTPEEEAAADAAFEAGFTETRDEQTPAIQTNQDASASTAPQANTDGAQLEHEDPVARAAADEAARLDAEANAPVTLTKAELDGLRNAASLIPQLQDELRKTRDTTAGKLGSLQQTLDAVRTQAQQGQRPTVKQLKRLEGEFPELAKLLSEDLEEAFGNSTVQLPADQTQGDGRASGGQSPGAAPAAPVDPLSDPKVQQLLRSKEMAIVDAVHPDWRALTQTAEFNQWRASLPTPAQQLLASTWDANVMVPAFKDFKSWSAKRQAAAAANKQRDKRLEHGVPATTGRATGANAVDEDTAFLSGYKEVRG